MAVTAAVLLLAAGCSSDDGDDESESLPAVEAGAGTTAAEETTEAETVDIDETVWFAGFELTLGEASYAPEELSSQVSIDVDVANEGEDTASLFAVELALESGGQSYPSDGASDLPEVPGGATGKGTFTFTVDEDFSFDDAVLTIGQSGTNQSVVPLGDEGELIPNEPADIEGGSSGTAGDLTIALTGGQARYDDPATHTQLDKGASLIILEMDVTRAGGQRDANFFGAALSLRLPDGTSVAVRSDGYSSPNEIVAGDTTLRGIVARFEGDVPFEGDYVLVVKWTTEDGTGPEATAEIPFTVEAPSGATSGTGTTSGTAGTGGTAGGTGTTGG